MAEQNISVMVDKVNASLERLEKLIRERYTQTIQNFFERSTERLRREIQTGFASMSFTQASRDLTALVESFAKFENDLEPLTANGGIQQELTQMKQEFGARFETIEKQLSEILATIGSLASEPSTPQGTVSERLHAIEKQKREVAATTSMPPSERMAPQDVLVVEKAGDRAVPVLGLKNELKEELSYLYEYLRWVNDPPGEMKAKTEIIGRIEAANEKVQQISKENSLPLSLRNRAYELGKLLVDTGKTISVSTQGKFYAEDIQKMAAPLIRQLKRFLAG